MASSSEWAGESDLEAAVGQQTRKKSKENESDEKSGSGGDDKVKRSTSTAADENDDESVDSLVKSASKLRPLVEESDLEINAEITQPISEEEEEGDMASEEASLDHFKEEDEGGDEDEDDENDEAPPISQSLLNLQTFTRAESEVEVDIVPNVKSFVKTEIAVRREMPTMASYLHDIHAKTPSFLFESTQINYVTIFEGLALSAILEEVYLQLEILGHAFPGTPQVSEDTDFLTYDEKFTLEVKEKELVWRPVLINFKNPFVIDPTQIGSHEERVSHKLQKDKAFIQEIFRLAKVEIDEHRTFELLKEHVMREDGRRNEEITLMEREKLAKQNVALMRKKIQDFKEQMFRDEHNRNEMINHLKDQLFQEKQKGRMDARYTRAWFEARNEFNFSQSQHTSDLARLKIKHLEIQMTRDRLCHENIVAWSKLMCNEIQGKVGEWNAKFEIGVEEMEVKIRDRQETLRSLRAMIEGLNNTIEQRTIELAPWDAVKDAERAEKAYLMRLHFSARIIQRWWRAYMTKHQLYKAKAGKKKGKKGKSKGARKSKSPKAKKK